MGSGKSSALINHINDSKTDVKFIYVTPYLKEVERIIKSCPNKEFKQPLESDGFQYSKLRGLKILLKQEQNIVTTHALFHYFDEETINLIHDRDYILVLDEVVDVISPYLKENSKSKQQGITRSDLDDLLRFHAEVDDKTKLLKWTDSTYDGNQNEYKILCDLNSLALYGSDNYPLWLFPIKIFEAFQECYVLTYMFYAQIQKYYYDMYGVKYDYMGVQLRDGKYYLTANCTTVTNIDYGSLIHICEKDKLNRIGRKPTDLSKSWYTRNRNTSLMVQLKNNTANFFKNICRANSSQCIWTSFKGNRKDLQGKGYTKGFLSCNMRAINEYSNRHCVAYLMNRYMNPIIKNFFLQYGISVDEDAFALSEMLQFIWRSAIRNGEEIYVYIPSIRMRNLLKQWIEEISIQNKGETNIENNTK